MQPAAMPVPALPLFANLTPGEEQDILAAGKARHFAKGDYLFHRGDELGHFYVLLDGAVREFRETPDGKEVTVNLAVRGDLIGASHLFEACTTYQWDGRALEPSEAIAYPVFWFKEKVRQNSTLALNLLAALSHQAHQAAIDAEHLITYTAAQRVACFLLRLCFLYDFDPQHFSLPFSKSTIASKLGMELETFSRTLQTLKKYGVDVKGGEVHIADFHRLEQYVCEHCSISEDCAIRDNLPHCGEASHHCVEVCGKR